MVIYQDKQVRVLQHPFLNVFHIQKWQQGDDPRSYGRTWDYFTVRECQSIDEVNQYVQHLVNSTH